MKNNYISFVCILFLILGSSYGEVRADELIRYNMDEVTTSGTIIRHYKEGMDVVCYQLSYNAYFLLYDEGSPTSYVLYVDMDTITDFEIYDDTIYFCGLRHESVGGWATFGYFRVTDIASPGGSANVAYLHLPLMSDVSALEVGWFADRKHVVILGKDLKEEGMVLDAIDGLSHWDMNFAEMGGDTIEFVDMAITKKYVVATSEKICHYGGEYEYGGCLWFINKPIMSGASLFPSSINYLDFAHHSFFGVRPQINAMELDSFIVAYRQSFHLASNNNFKLFYFDGMNYITSISIQKISDFIINLGDIGYEKNSRSVEILVYGIIKNSIESAYRSLIFEIPDVNTLQPTAAIKAHIYDGVFFESLDYTFNREHFVTSGIKVPGSLNRPYYMKFKYNEFYGGCLVEETDIYKKFESKIRKDNKLINKTYIYQVPEVKEKFMKEMSIETPCSYSNNKQ